MDDAGPLLRVHVPLEAQCGDSVAGRGPRKVEQLPSGRRPRRRLVAAVRGTRGASPRAAPQGAKAVPPGHPIEVSGEGEPECRRGGAVGGAADVHAGNALTGQEGPPGRGGGLLTDTFMRSAYGAAVPCA